MSRGKRLTIAYLNTKLHQDWSFQSWRGAVHAAKKYGVDLVSFHGQPVRTSSGYYQQENVLYDIAKSEKNDGYIIWKGNISSDLSDEEFNKFCISFGKPFVTVEGSFPGHPSITYENYEGMRAIIDHLIETHGYEEIGFVGIEEVETKTGFRERYKAFCDSMKDHSLSINPLFVVPYREWNRPANGFPWTTPSMPGLRKASRWILRLSSESVIP